MAEKEAALQESEERRKEQEQQMIVQQMRSEQLEKDGKVSQQSPGLCEVWLLKNVFKVFILLS